LSTGDTATVAGSGDDFNALWGGYVAATLIYQVNDRWSLAAGVQYQALQSYEHSFGGRNVEINLRNTFYLTIGAGYSF
jgi:long-subunit fatty acid transport protein